MAKKRNYASEETLMAALAKEGLLEVCAVSVEKDGDRLKPVFLTEDPDLIKRLDAEGFEHRALPPPPDGIEPGPDGLKPDDGSEDGGDYLEGDAGPMAARHTFTVPEGHVAIRDAEGRATGETRPMTADEVLAKHTAEEEARLALGGEQASGPDDDESGEMAAAGHPGAEDDDGEPVQSKPDGAFYTDGTPVVSGDYVRMTIDSSGIVSLERAEPPALGVEVDGPAVPDWTPEVAAYRAALPRLANAGLSDLFFNHDHSAYHRLYSVATAAGTLVNPKDEEAAVKEAAEEFAGMVLNAFGVAVNVDELVADFFARL